ncbi:MAG: LamG domain-containing protein [Elusimicrobiota bacterium]
MMKQKNLSLFCAGALVSAALLVCASESRAALVGAWSFDEGSGNIAADSSGSGNDAAVLGARWIDSPVGGGGSALSFDGIDDLLNGAGGAATDFTDQPFTVMAWVYPFADDAGVIFDNRYNISGGDSGWMMGLYSDGTLVFDVNGADNNAVTFSEAAAYEPKRWQLIAVTRDGPAVNFYVGGVKIGETAVIADLPVAYSLAHHYIGMAGGAYADHQYGIPNRYFYGAIDEVRVHDTALTESEILQHYEAYKPATQPPPIPELCADGLDNDLDGRFDCFDPDCFADAACPALLAHYTFDDCGAADSSGYGHDGDPRNFSEEDCVDSGLIGGGKALMFDGYNNYVANVGGPLADFTTLPYTFTAWVKPAALDAGIILDNRYEINGNDSGWMVGMMGPLYDPGGIVFDASNGLNENWTFTSPALPYHTEEWHLLAVTRDGPFVTFFADGVQAGDPVSIGSARIRYDSFTSHRLLGAVGANYADHQYDIPNRYFNGALDEVRIYRGALSQAELQQHYEQYAPPPPPPPGPEVCDDGLDNDRDGWADCLDPNCFEDPACPILVARYTFDDCTAADSSGNGHDGILSGFSPEDCVDSGLEGGGKAVYFDGLDNYGYNIGGESTDFRGEPFTVMAWVNLASLDAGAILDNRYEIGGFDSGWLFGVSGTQYGPGNIVFDPSNGTSNNWTFSSQPAVQHTGEWHLLAVQKNGSNATFYVDGVQVGDPVAVGAPPIVYELGTYHRVLGRVAGAYADHQHQIPNRYFRGYMDEVRIYRAIMTESRIREIYEEYAPPTPPPAVPEMCADGLDNDRDGWLDCLDPDCSADAACPPLVARYSFDDCTAADNSGFGNDAVMNYFSESDCVDSGLAGGGKALVFDGIDNYISDAGGAFTDFTDHAFTVMAWVKPSGDDAGAIFDNRYEISGDDSGWLMGLYEGGQVAFDVNGIDGNFLTYSDVEAYLPDGWQLIAVTRSGTEVDFYVNGAKFGDTRTISGQAVLYDWFTGHHLIGKVGASYANHEYGIPNRYFNGVMDEFRIYRGALSEEDILQVYEEFTASAPDADEDGVPDAEDNCPLAANASQEDADADGAGDACDACPNDPADDADGDGLCADADNCPSSANPGQEDLDADGQGDACDPDDDDDGVDDAADNCPMTANAGQADNDADGAGDACDPDDDDDGVDDAADNCPMAANAGQADNDADGAGDACDPDDDGDGDLDEADNCPMDPNPDQADLDGDGLGDACDDDLDGDGTANDEDGDAAEVIGEEGGVVETDDAVVTIPPGSFEEPATVTVISTTGSFKVSTNKGEAFGLADYAITPEGATFGEPVTIVFTYDDTLLKNPRQEEKMDAFWLNPETGGWEAQNAELDMEANTLTLHTYHFSNFAISAPDDADGDGVYESFEGETDACPGSTADGIALNPNQYAQNAGFGAFEVGPDDAQSSVYDMLATKGCTCRQIVAMTGAGQGHLKKGCSPGLMEGWTGLSVQPDRPPDSPGGGKKSK